MNQILDSETVEIAKELERNYKHCRENSEYPKDWTHELGKH